MSPKLRKMALRGLANYCRPRLESLEVRCLPDVGPGIYVEDFTDNGNLADPNDDVPAFTVPPSAFQHCFVNNGQTHFITNPGDILGSHYEIIAAGSDNDALLLFEGRDQITFNLEAGLHVALASIDVRAVRQSQVEFVGRNGTAVLDFNPEVPAENVGVGQGHILPSGDRLGPIQQINLVGHAFFDNLDILVIESQGPQALDDFVGTPPRRPVRVDVLENDTDPDGQKLRIVGYTQPANGMVEKIRLTPPGGGPARDVFRYTPNGDYHGRDSFTYTVADPDGNRATATVNVSVNTPPTAQSRQLFMSHSAPGPITGRVEIGDLDGDVIESVRVTSPPAGGTLTLNPDGTFVYEPTLIDRYDFETGKTIFNESTVRGPDEFTYQVSDGMDVSEGIVVFVVPNTVPEVRDDRFVVPATPQGATPELFSCAAPGVLWNENPSWRPNLYPGFAVDSDLDPLSAVLVDGPDHGVLVLNRDGSFTYLPEPGYVGLDGFTYRATDGAEASRLPATVTLVVRESTELDPVPVLRDDFFVRDFLHEGEYELDPIGNDLLPDLMAQGVSIQLVKGPFARVVETTTAEETTTVTFFVRSDCVTGRRTLAYAMVDMGDPADPDDTVISNFATITLEVPAPDTDGDGITDPEEDCSTLPDGASQTASRTSFLTFDGRRRLNLSATTPGGDPLSLSDVEAIPNPHPSDTPAGVSFPIGFISFAVNLAAPGQAAIVSLTQSQATVLDFSVNAYYKYGPEPGNPVPHWYNFAYDPATQTGAVITELPFGSSITLHFVDGQRGDDDLTANGVIVDPGAPAHLPGPPVALVQINDGSPQRSRINRLVVTFDDVVTLDAGALRLKRGNTFIKLNVVTEILGDHTVATLTFPRSQALRPLQAGNYTLIIRGMRVESQFGFRLDGDGDGQDGGNARIQFRSRFGDGNGDGKLDTVDRDLFLAALGSSEGDPEYLWYFDRNGDGVIDNKDPTRALRRLIRIA